MSWSASTLGSVSQQSWGQPGQQGWGQPTAQNWYPQQPAQWNRPQQPWTAPGQYPPQAPVYGYQQPGPPQAGYRQPAPPQWQPPRGPQPPHKSPFKAILIALILLAGVAVFVISLLSFLAPGDERSGGTVTTIPTVPTSQAPAPTQSGPASPPPTSTAQPTQAYEAPPPDMNPPELPYPETYGQARDWLVENAVYAQAIVKPTQCDLPEVDPTTASKAELTQHLNDLTACLMAVWEAPLNEAGFKMPRPPATVYTEPITTGCGTLDEVNAVYCAADQRIYYAKPIYRIFPENLQQARFLIEMIIGHEFGHAIQARSGILISSAAWQQQVSAAEGRVFSRRLETQADCLAGMFTSSVGPTSGLTDNDMATLKKLAYNLGDDVLTGKAGYDGDHGSGKSRQRWFTKGVDTLQIGSCNTYNVPASQVR